MKLKETLSDFIEGMLLGATITTSIATILFVVLFIFFSSSIKVLGISLFWGLLSFIFGMFYLALVGLKWEY